MVLNELYSHILLRALVFSTEIPEVERFDIVKRTIQDLSRKGPIDSKKFVSEVSRGEQRFLSRPREPFVLATNLSVAYSEKLRSRRLSGATITLSPKLPDRFDRSIVLDIARGQINYKEPPVSHAAVRIHVRSRTERQAGEEALDNLDVLRGIWNLFLGSGSYRMFAVGRPQPLNTIVLGQVHTLHAPSGRLVRDVVWYEPGFAERATTYLRSKEERLVAFENEVRSRLTKSNYSDKIEVWLRRYARALDGIDWDTALLKLWSLLESMTDTTNLRYDVTVRRASFVGLAASITPTRSLSKQMLQALREYRNALVHSDSSTQFGERLVTILKIYIESLLAFHLWKGSKLGSPQEAAELLDHTTDVAELRRRQDLLQEVLALIGGQR